MSIDQEYKDFSKWCRDNPAYDLDPRLHTHSGRINDGGYISHKRTGTAFKAWQASRQALEGEPVNGSRIEEVCVQALIDISSCAWGIEGYDTSEDAANWMWNNANTALAEMWDSDLSALNSEKIQSPVGYTNWAQLSYVKSDGQGSFYPDTADDCFIPLYTHPASRQAVSVPSILYDGYAVFQEVQHDRNSKGLKNIKDSALVSDVLDAVVKLIKQEQDL